MVEAVPTLHRDLTNGIVDKVRRDDAQRHGAVIGVSACKDCVRRNAREQ